MKNEEFNKQITFRVRQLMQDKHLTQYEIAEIIGRAQSSVSRLMSGKGVWRTEYLNAIATFCDISPDYFTTHESNSDTVLWGTKPRESQDDLMLTNLQNQYDELVEANAHLTDYTNELLAELNSVKDELEKYKAERDQRVLVASPGLTDEFKAMCQKQLAASISLMQSAMMLVEVGG